MKRLRKLWCRLFGCRPVTIAVYEDGYGRPSSAALHCYRCDTAHGYNL